MEAIAKVRNLRGSARKARLVLDLIRGKRVVEAKNILMFSKKRFAANIEKVLDSAVANANYEHGKVDIDNLIVSTAFADDGPIMKRFMPRALGRAYLIRKRSCHITIAVKDKE